MRSTYTVLYNLRFDTIEVDILKKVCSKVDTTKVIFFLWRLFYDRLPNKDNLIKRNIQLDHQHSLCVFCNEEDEIHICSSHVLLHMKFGENGISSLI